MALKSCRDSRWAERERERVRRAGRSTMVKCEVSCRYELGWWTMMLGESDSYAEEWWCWASRRPWRMRYFPQGTTLGLPLSPGLTILKAATLTMVVHRRFSCSWGTGLALNSSQPLRLCGSVDQSRDLQSKCNTELFLDPGAANASIRDRGQYEKPRSLRWRCFAWERNS